MNDLAVIVPSRGRPENIERLAQAWEDTEAEAQLIVCVDNDDPALDGYREVFEQYGVIDAIVGPRKRLVPWLNAVAPYEAQKFDVVGFMGDDHCPQVRKWDAAIFNELWIMKTGFAYGDDLLQSRALPTAWFMTSDIVDRLGYMIPPCLVHMWADNWVFDIGTAIGKLRYLSDVTIEHLHPVAGKTPNTAQYDEVAAFMEPDQVAYEKYKTDGSFDADVAKLKELIK
jgi:hypothetical protein